jgi:hypothetical protein
MPETLELTLPARGNSEKTGDQERLYRTALNSKDYLRLEIESMDRGLKPFGLTKSVMTLYLHKQLVYLKELPIEIQEQINVHFKTKQNTARSNEK